MFPPKKILFPVDFSDRCHDAARMAANFAERFQARLTLLYAVEPITFGCEYAYDTVAPAQAVLDTYLVDEFQHLDVDRVLSIGEAGKEIIDYAHKGKFDLIMLPTHGYGLFRRLLLGSVAAKVLHDALCPVWTSVHVEEIAPPEKIKFQNIVCAIDFGPQTCSALKWAAGFAGQVGADLTIAHVIPTAKNTPDSYTDLAFKNELLHQAKEKIEQLQQSLGTQAHVSIVANEVPTGVRGCAEECNADLLVLGRSVRDGLMGRLRPNAYAIIRQSPCPVVSV